MADEKPNDQKAHQHKLAQSGYRLPDAMYAADQNAGQESTEKESGDGGKAAGGVEQESQHGYKGELLGPEQIAAQSKQASGASQQGGVSYASGAAEQAAADANLTDADFEGIEPSGANGGYTKADIDKAAARKAEK